MSRNVSCCICQVITPHTSTLGSVSSDLIPTIRGILVSECWLTPLLRITDYMTNAKKHIIAPRAQNQEDMMLWFQGTFYNLGERYTVSRFHLFLFLQNEIKLLQQLTLFLFSTGLDKDRFRGFLLLFSFPFCLCFWIHHPYDSVCRGSILSLSTLGMESNPR